MVAALLSGRSRHYTVCTYSIRVGASPVRIRGSVPAWVVRLAYAVQAGFSSPAEDYATKAIDLNDVLIRHKQATFLMKVKGLSMREAGIDDGDTVVVDRAIKPVHGHIVVAVVDNEFTVKRLWKRAGRIKLQAANPTYPDIVPKEGQTVEVWGVVTNAIDDMADDGVQPAYAGLPRLSYGNRLSFLCRPVTVPFLLGRSL